MKDFDFSKFEGLTADNKDLQVDFLPLNFDALQKIGAFRVTNQGLPDGSFNPDPTAGFSLVSKWNDLSGENTKKWIDNPAAYSVVKNMFTTTPENMGAYKYMQIVESARQLGLKDKDIFSKPQKEAITTPFYADPFGDTTK